MPQMQDLTPQPPMRAVALYDNGADSADELAFRSGEVLSVLELDYSGYQGWWLCSLRGKQGICPGNRLKLLTEPELMSPSQRKQPCQPVKSVTIKPEVYLYDQPKPTMSTPAAEYDIVPTIHPPVDTVDNGAGERYDVPRPLQPPLSPTSSHGSLTSDSNRSSLLQEYDVPKPARQIPHPQEEYDVPRETPLELGAALERVGRLEGEASTAVRAVLACAVTDWRRRDLLRPRLAHVKATVMRLRAALAELTAFGRAALVNSAVNPGGRGMSERLRPLVESLCDGCSRVEGCAGEVDSAGWSCDALCLEEGHSTPGGDALDSLVATAATLQEDISALASFLQGNATLLFRRGEDTVQGKPWQEDYDYVNIDCKEGRPQGRATSQEPSATDPADIKVLGVFRGEIGPQLAQLSTAVGAFLDSVEQSQPPRVFLNRVKLILLAGHRLVQIADAASRGVSSKQVSDGLNLAADSLSDSLQSTVRTTKEAALHFPNMTTVQKMVDSVYSVYDLARQTRRVLDTPC